MSMPAGRQLPRPCERQRACLLCAHSHSRARRRVRLPNSRALCQQVAHDWHWVALVQGASISGYAQVNAVAKAGRACPRLGLMRPGPMAAGGERPAGVQPPWKAQGFGGRSHIMKRLSSAAAAQHCARRRRTCGRGETRVADRPRPAANTRPRVRLVAVNETAAACTSRPRPVVASAAWSRAPLAAPRPLIGFTRQRAHLYRAARPSAAASVRITAGFPRVLCRPAAAHRDRSDAGDQ